LFGPSGPTEFCIISAEELRFCITDTTKMQVQPKGHKHLHAIKRKNNQIMFCSRQQNYLKPEYIIPVRDVLKAPPNNLTPKRETYYVEFGP